MLNFDSFAPASRWEKLSVLPTIIPVGLRWLHDLQLYSDQPVSVLPTSLQASLPRWLEEKDTRVAMLFGWAFERAVGAYFQRQDAAASLYREWSSHRESGLHYSERDSWNRMLQSGVQLLDRFARDDRIRMFPSRIPPLSLQATLRTPYFLIGGHSLTDLTL